MNILLNGKEADLKDSLTLQELLAEMKIDPHVVAVELNLSIIKRKDYPTTKIRAGDRLEILQMIGGG